MVTFRAEYGDLPTLSLAKVSSLSGVSVAEHHVLASRIGKSVPATEHPAVDHCRLLAMVKINTVDRAVKSLDRTCCKDGGTNSASSPQGKRDDGTYSTRSSPVIWRKVFVIQCSVVGAYRCGRS